MCQPLSSTVASLVYFPCDSSRVASLAPCNQTQISTHTDTCRHRHRSGQITLFRHGMPLFHCTMVSPYQPFSGIDRAMASWHGWRVMNLFSPKLQVKKSILAIDFIWIRALRLIFSQIYITRHCLSFFRPPSFSRILCFWEFRISENFGQTNIW